MSKLLAGFRRLGLPLLVAGACAVSAASAAPQGAYGLKSAWQNTFLATSGSTLTMASDSQSDATQWDFEPIENSEDVRIRSIATGKYLHIETGSLGLGDIQPGWLSARWTAVSAGESRIRLQNAWKKNLYIHIENGDPAVGDIQPGWLSAMWFLDLQPGVVINASAGTEPDVEEAAPAKSAGQYVREGAAVAGDIASKTGDVLVDGAVYVADGTEKVAGKVAEGAVIAYKETEKFVTGGETPEGRKAIKFNNQAGYVAKMQVMYMVKKDIGGTIMDMPEVQETSNITLGFTRPLVMPENLATDKPIRIFIVGVATTTNPVYTTEVPGTFAGEKCYKAWGTFASAQGGTCN